MALTSWSYIGYKLVYYFILLKSVLFYYYYQENFKIHQVVSLTEFSFGGGREEGQ